MDGLRYSGADKRPVCLVLMPMLAGFEDIRELIKAVANKAGFEMCRLEQEVEDSAWHLWLLDSIERADLALVDVTDNNPYVMYELGYAHHKRLPTALIVNARNERVSATIHGSVCTPYGAHCPVFEQGLIDHLQQTRIASRMDRQADTMLDNVSALYAEAVRAADEFDGATSLLRVAEPLFRQRLGVEHRRGSPSPRGLHGAARARFLLSLLLSRSDRIDVMRAICEWSFKRNRSRECLAADDLKRLPLPANTPHGSG